MSELDTPREELARLIAMAGYAAWCATLIGNAPPSTKALYDRMRAPQPGDLVVETSTLHRTPWDPGAVGRLLRTAMEPRWTRERWIADGGDADEPIRTEQIWYVAPFVPTQDGRDEVRWWNASFIAIPDVPSVDEWSAAREAE